MSTARAALSLLTAGLLLAACEGKPENGPFVDTLDGKPQPGQQAQPAPAPAATAPAATAPSAIPPSGDPAKGLDPQFYLPADSELTTTASGLKYLVIREGSGAKPTKASRFSAHYCGWFTNGEKFDSSYERGQPLAYPVNLMIKCWQEALTTLMAPGAEYILVVPPALGYGAGGNGIPPDSTLVFRMQLLSFNG